MVFVWDSKKSKKLTSILALHHSVFLFFKLISWQERSATARDYRDHEIMVLHPADKMCVLSWTTCWLRPQIDLPYTLLWINLGLCVPERLPACELAVRLWLFQVTQWTEVERKFIMEPFYLCTGPKIADSTQIKVHRKRVILYVQDRSQSGVQRLSLSNVPVEDSFLWPVLIGYFSPVYYFFMPASVIIIQLLSQAFGILQLYLTHL